MIPDRRALLEQASQLRIVMRDQNTPWRIRIKAKKAAEKIEVALRLLAALERKMDSGSGSGSTDSPPGGR